MDNSNSSLLRIMKVSQCIRINHRSVTALDPGLCLKYGYKDNTPVSISIQPFGDVEVFGPYNGPEVDKNVYLAKITKVSTKNMLQFPLAVSRKLRLLDGVTQFKQYDVGNGVRLTPVLRQWSFGL